MINVTKKKKKKSLVKITERQTSLVVNWSSFINQSEQIIPEATLKLAISTRVCHSYFIILLEIEEEEDNMHKHTRNTRIIEGEVSE